MDAEQKTVLVVEDEPLLLRLNESILKKNGFAVLSARSGGEAMEVAQSHAGSIDLLLTDLHLPEMDGEALAAEVSRLYDGLQIIFLTGSCCEETIDRLGRCHRVLCKPFGMDTLLSTVRAVLIL